MNDTSEEKALPASEKKLREAREKGQIPHSREMVTAVVTVVSFGYLVLRAPQFSTALTDGLSSVPDSYDLPFMQAVSAVSGRLGLDLLSAVVPLAALIVASAVIANLAVNGGLVVSMTPITPKPENIDPVAGFKRMVGLRNVVELLKSLCKFAVVAYLAYRLVTGSLQAMVEIPSCGLPCGIATFGELLRRLLLVMAGLFLALGVFDIGLQRWLFSRDQRMTVTEMKRERKDSEGDPEVKKHQRGERQGRGAKTGLRNATFGIRSSRTVLAMRYSTVDTPVPALVARATGEGVAPLLAELSLLRIPIVYDEATVESISSKLKIGGFITKEMFQPIVACMHEAGVI